MPMHAGRLTYGLCDGSGSGVVVAEGELVVEGCALELEVESTGEQPKTVRSKAPADSEAARVRQVEAIAGSSLLYAIYGAKTINMVRPPCPCTRDVSHMVTKLPYCEQEAIAGSSLLYAIYGAKTINMVRPPCPCTRDVSHMVTKLPYCEQPRHE